MGRQGLWVRYETGAREAATDPVVGNQARPWASPT